MYSNFQHEILQAIADNEYEHASVIGAKYEDDARFVIAMYDFACRGLIWYSPDATKEQFVSNISHYTPGSYPFNLSYHVLLSEKGHAVLDKYNDRIAKLSALQNDNMIQAEQLDSLRKMLEAYKGQIEDARRNTLFAGLISVLSLIVSIIAIC